MCDYCYRIVVVRLKPITPKKLHRRIFSQLWMLALQFILGMMLNLIGNEASGAKHTVYNVVLIAHIVNAIGLLEGGVFIALKEQSKLSWWATIFITITFCGGILTVLTKQDAWSFVMACSFLVSSCLYIVLYMRADRKIHDEELRAKP